MLFYCLCFWIKRQQIILSTQQNAGIRNSLLSPLFGERNRRTPTATSPFTPLAGFSWSDHRECLAQCFLTVFFPAGAPFSSPRAQISPATSLLLGQPVAYRRPERLHTTRACQPRPRYAPTELVPPVAYQHHQFNRHPQYQFCCCLGKRSPLQSSPVGVCWPYQSRASNRTLSLTIRP